jgi:homoserine dehydrogenase
VSGRSAATSVLLLGFGQVGRAFARMLPPRPGLRLAAVADRSGFVLEPAGLPVEALVRAKARGRSLRECGGRPGSASDAVAAFRRAAWGRGLVVDATADETGPVLRPALSAGLLVVLANKKPIAGPWRDYRALLASAGPGGGRLRFEATVGAGLPVIDTFHKLVESGDHVRRVEGSLSGTLGFVLSEVGRGRAFSEAVRVAKARGYTELDPREDLCGRDAWRKGLILSRLLGFRGEPPPPLSLVPPALAGLATGRFLERLGALDAAWRRRAERAARRGRVWRYVVRAERGGATAGLRAVPRESPLGALVGTNSLVAFTTGRYSPEPLVISGPGAGAELTASALVSDVLDCLSPS